VTLNDPASLFDRARDGHGIVDLPLYPLAGGTAHWALVRSTAKALGPDLRLAVLTAVEVGVAYGSNTHRVRETLLRARAHHRPPWDELTMLGQQIGVPELSDVGQIMQAAGQSGAQVNRTLLERADSLRDQIRADALAKAEATTGKLEIPGAVLLFILAAFVIYPITQRVYIGIS
jgi:hypothetical protein